MITKVYTSFMHTGMDTTTLLQQKLQPLNKVLTEQYKKEDKLDVLKCPAFKEEIKNTFVYYAPYDYTFEYDKNGKPLMSHLSGDKQKMAPETVNFDDSKGVYDFRLIQTFSSMGPIFFSEKSLSMSTLPPYMHNIKAPMVVGNFDIGKWFRNVHPAYVMSNINKIEVKRGEPLLYVKFHTDKKVRLSYYDLTDDIYSIVAKTAMVKTAYKNAKLNELYNFFTNSLYKKKLLKLIKENLE